MGEKSLIPAEQTQITQLPGPDQMPCGEDEPEEEAEGGRGNVGGAQELRAPADPRDRREDNRLGPVEHADGVVVVDADRVASRLHRIVVIPLVQLAERRQPRDLHPDHKVLVVARVEDVARAVVVGPRVGLAGEVASPVRRGDERGRVLRRRSVLFLLARPDDVLLGHDIGAGRVLHLSLRRGRADGGVEEDRVEDCI